MKKLIILLFIIFSVPLSAQKINSGSFGMRSNWGVEIVIPIFNHLGIGYAFQQPKHEAYSFLNYSDVINYSEFPEDHRETIYNQNIHSNYLILSFELLNYNFGNFNIDCELGFTYQVDVLNCYDKSHILGSNGEYQLFLNGRNVFSYGINIKYIFPIYKLPFYVELGYNIHSKVYFGLGIGIPFLFNHWNNW